MPELPEVETTRRGIEPHINNQRITNIDVRQPSLRWPVPDSIQQLVGARVSRVQRRGKYLLLRTPKGTAIIHLGMSGSLRLTAPCDAWRTHDHAAITLSNKMQLRYHDPRRFGSILMATGDPLLHELLARLGPEPLDDSFTGEYLFARARATRRSIKMFIMDSTVVVGVGNIYASESLFLAGIRPGRSAMRVTRLQYRLLAGHIKTVLSFAIERGGTTLRDFVNSQGNPGYFKQELQVYGRAGEPCHHCATLIKTRVIGQRSSFYCPHCQL